MTERDFDAVYDAAVNAKQVDAGPWYYDGRDIFTRSHAGASYCSF